MLLRLLFLAILVALLCGCAQRRAHRFDTCIARGLHTSKSNYEPVELNSEFESTHYAHCTTIHDPLELEGPVDLFRLESVSRGLQITPGAAPHVRRHPLIHLPRLLRVSGDMTIGRTGRYVRELILAAPALTAIDGDLRVEQSGQLTSLRLPSLRRVEGDLVIRGNPELVDVSLPSLRSVGGDISIEPFCDEEEYPGFSLPNGVLRALDLRGLIEVGGAISVRENPRLVFLELDRQVQAGGPVVVGDDS